MYIYNNKYSRTRLFCTISVFLPLKFSLRQTYVISEGAATSYMQARTEPWKLKYVMAGQLFRTGSVDRVVCYWRTKLISNK
jgi:hypothetical protein